MKPMSEWIHQPDVDQAGDTILAEGKMTLDTITAYQVAERLDRSANPSMYAKFRDWRARREAEAQPAAGTIDVPPEVEAKIRAIFDRLNSEGVDACLNAVRVVGGNLDRVMTMRVTVAERRAEKAEAETTEVLAIGEKTEEELRSASGRVAELEQAVADGRRREDRLAGRIEQLKADLAVALRHRPNEQIASTDCTAGVDASNLQAGDADRADRADETGDDDDGAGDERDGTNSDGGAGYGDAGTGGAGDAASVSPTTAAAADHMRQMVLRWQGIGAEDNDDLDADPDENSSLSS